MRSRRAAALSLAALTLLLGCLLSLYAGATIVVTHGVSMQPTINAGDLVIAWPASSYDVGDVVAYQSSMLDTTVLHRIVAHDERGWTFQGDNNSWLDPEHPAADQLLGRQIVHVPHAGSALAWAAQTRLWVVIALVGLIAGGTTRHIRKVGPVAQHRKKSARPPGWSKPAAAAGATVVLALTIAVAGAQLLTAPPVAARTPAATTAPASSDQTLTFDYSAALRPSAASGDGSAVAPDPVFRALADDVTIKISYGGPDVLSSVNVVARIATTSGWHEDIPLLKAIKIPGGSWDGTVPLHLPELANRANAASAAIGAPAGEVHVALTPTIVTGDQTFERTLDLVLDATALRLEDPVASLTFSDAGTELAAAGGVPAGALSAARAAAFPYGAPALGVGALLVWLLHWRQQSRLTPLERSRRRHTKLLLPSQPVAAPFGAAIVDVHDLDRLAALAGGWQLPILHWADSTGEVFMVIAEQTAYRHRVDTYVAPAPPAKDPTASLALA
ncbi:MAG: hypothetical protein JWM62_2077 [Frankiales bacterium]|nr:hypothetical protein [Frankiales bacterium]